MSDKRDDIWQSLESNYDHRGRAPQAVETPDKPTSDRLKTHRGERRSHLMLNLTFKAGDSFSLSYSYLIAMKFNHTTGIELEFSGYRIHLQGRGLVPLYRGLLEHVVGQVTEIDMMADAAAEDRPPTAVYAIKVETL
jgi:hypothetical protein